MSFLNSRKVSWIIFGITLLTAVVSLFFLPDIIPVHFGILGTPDGWDYKMGILLFPILQFFLLFLTGRKKVKDFMETSDFYKFSDYVSQKQKAISLLESSYDFIESTKKIPTKDKKKK